MTRAPLAILALIGAALLVVAEFTAVVEVVVGSLETVVRSDPGRSHHAYALLIVAVAAVPMAVGALRGARPAATALAVLGLVALGVALAVDLPDAHGSGRLPESVTFEDARARPGLGLYLE
ncbi:MAG: hypothetical protein M3296_02485, partial [Actinomycetota bacterium]|nr:hypothetical protein [Actinomycetota bacterium]